MTAFARADLERILEVMGRLRGVDLRDYWDRPIAMGIAQRMVATRHSNISAYVETLEADARELDALIDAALVRHTSFFRDAPVFAALEHTVLPSLARRRQNRALRAWSIGTATGEEAWSLAMVCAGLHLPFDVLGTDVSRAALSAARAASYPASSRDEVPPPLQRFLRGGDMTVTIAPELPAHVRFVVHDLVGQRLAPPDAVLASFDLALLRNVLIYFEPRLQQKALERLAAVLEPDGVAVLGPCERVPAALDRWFRPYQGLDPMLRIYKIRSP